MCAGRSWRGGLTLRSLMPKRRKKVECCVLGCCALVLSVGDLQGLTTMGTLCLSWEELNQRCPRGCRSDLPLISIAAQSCFTWNGDEQFHFGLPQHLLLFGFIILQGKSVFCLFSCLWGFCLFVVLAFCCFLVWHWSFLWCVVLFVLVCLFGVFLFFFFL